MGYLSNEKIYTNPCSDIVKGNRYTLYGGYIWNKKD